MGMVIAAIAVAGILGIFTDWLFMGLLFHDAYKAHPEIWRVSGNNTAGIVWASALGFVMSAGVIALCALVGVHTVSGGLGVALLAFFAGPFIVIVVNGLFVKFDPRITFAHSLGYLARMAIAGIAAGAMLPLS